MGRSISAVCRFGLKEDVTLPISINQKNYMPCPFYQRFGHIVKVIYLTLKFLRL